jgi:hypothetical protein
MLGRQVYYHGPSGEQVSTHEVRLPREACVADVLAALGQQLPPEGRPAQLRLLEVFYSKIYKARDLDLFPHGSLSRLWEPPWQEATIHISCKAHLSAAAPVRLACHLSNHLSYATHLYAAAAPVHCKVSPARIRQLPHSLLGRRGTA